jgi:DNA invertase Pin-like site-specific DNA recombinase
VAVRALYARVSTKDKAQDPEMQLVPMRAHAERQGWEWEEYVDKASAGDLAGRKDWKRLLTDVRAGRVDHIFTWALDRAFRSQVHCCTTLEDLAKLEPPVGFSTLTQPIDTSTAAGRFTIQILAAAAEFERALIRERVKEGLQNARRKGAKLGRPSVTERPGFAHDWALVRAEMAAGGLSYRAAAKRLSIGVATLTRLVETEPKRGGRPSLPKR